MDSSPSAQICWLHDPNVLLRLLLLNQVVVLLELFEFLRQDVGVRYNVKCLSPKLLLHLCHVEAKSIFSSYFVRLREVVNPLMFIHPFIQEGFAR